MMETQRIKSRSVAHRFSLVKVIFGSVLFCGPIVNNNFSFVLLSDILLFRRGDRSNKQKKYQILLRHPESVVADDNLNTVKKAPL